MAEDAFSLSNKQAKKAQRDAERRKGGSKKRKLEESEQPGKDDLEKDFLPLDAAADTTGGGSQNVQQSTAKPQKPTSSLAPDAVSSDSRPSKRKKTSNARPSDGPSKTRFIVFVGNLPYSTTDASLQLHFKKLSPFTLRHRIDPKTKKSKGFAFLEFENFDRMKTCLKLYHHSMFDPEAKETTIDQGGPSAEPGKKDQKVNKRARRINVELTAGGGGKNENRKEKIKAKNVRLEEQRQRRAELEKKEKAKSEEKKRRKSGKAATNPGETSADGGKDEGVANQSEGIHPARLARMQN